MKKICCFIATILIFLMLGCQTSDAKLGRKMIEKYSDEQSYVALSGEIIEVSDNNVVIRCKNLNSYISYEDNICTYLIFADRMLDLNVGDMVDYVTVPFHFYNGHHLPIVELKRNGETLLTFEEGRQNLLDWVNKRFM